MKRLMYAAIMDQRHWRRGASHRQVLLHQTGLAPRSCVKTTVCRSARIGKRKPARRAERKRRTLPENPGECGVCSYHSARSASPIYLAGM